MTCGSVLPFRCPREGKGSQVKYTSFASQSTPKLTIADVNYHEIDFHGIAIQRCQHYHLPDGPISKVDKKHD
jgi:hypothetical protein